MENNKLINQRFTVEEKMDIEKIINRIQGNESYIENHLIIPEYQRNYVWNDKINIPRLLASLYIGYPIGFITMWDNNINDEYQLIDGLQRYYSIYKIYEKPFNFLHYDMYVYWKRKDTPDYIKNKVDQENFRHFRSFLNHKKTNYAKRSKEECIDWINTTSRLENDLERNDYINFINEYNKWFETSFQKIQVPHFILKEYKKNDIWKIFEIMNSTGKKLNKFEIFSAHWSNHKINLDKEILFIKEFHNKRKQIYKDNFENQEKISKRIIDYDNKSIIPSNFIYAIFNEAIKNFGSLKTSFYDKNNNLQEKALESVSEIIKQALIEIKGLEDFEFEELGRELSENISNEKDVVDMLNLIKKSIEMLLQNISILSNQNEWQYNNINYPSWLISIFIILIMKKPSASEKKNYERWFIYDFLISNRLSSSTGNTAKEIIKNKEYNSSLEKEREISDDILISEIKKVIKDKKYDELYKQSTRDMKLNFILLMMQTKHMPNNKNRDVDHFIPQTLIPNFLNKNNIYNLQYMSKIENIEKTNKFIENQIQYDQYKDLYGKRKNEYIKYLNKFNKIIKNKNDDNYEYNVKQIYKKIIDIKKEVMLKELDNKHWLN